MIINFSICLDKIVSFDMIRSFSSGSCHQQWHGCQRNFRTGRPERKTTKRSFGKLENARESAVMEKAVSGDNSIILLKFFSFVYQSDNCFFFKKNFHDKRLLHFSPSFAIFLSSLYEVDSCIPGLFLLILFHVSFLQLINYATRSNVSTFVFHLSSSRRVLIWSSLSPPAYSLHLHSNATSPERLTYHHSLFY